AVSSACDGGALAASPDDDGHAVAASAADGRALAAFADRGIAHPSVAIDENARPAFADGAAVLAGEERRRLTMPSRSIDDAAGIRARGCAPASLCYR
ncbi:MAG: hypothetical protein AAF928_04795, partial [Myxococcota bacterium]